MGEELVGLEDHADAAADLGPGHAGGRQVLAVEEDLPGIDGLEAVDSAQERGLAAAGGTDDDDDFAVGDVEGNAAQGVVPAGVGLVEVDPPRKFFADPSSDSARRFLDIFSFEGAKL